MKTINLKEMYSNYYIREWKKQGLVLITERPPTTTEELLENFFLNYKPKKKYKTEAIRLEARKRNLSKKLDWRDYLPEQYK